MNSGIPSLTSSSSTGPTESGRGFSAFGDVYFQEDKAWTAKDLIILSAVLGVGIYLARGKNGSFFK